MTPDVEKLIAILSRKPIFEQMDTLHEIANEILENLQRNLKAKGADEETMNEFRREITHLYRYHIFYLMQKSAELLGTSVPEKDETWEELR